MPLGCCCFGWLLGGLLSLDSAPSFCASFVASRWSPRVTQRVEVSPIWPAFWVSSVDKTRGSKASEVRQFVRLGLGLSFL